MNKIYNKITWHNNTTPALSEDNLNAMSEAIDGIDDRVVDLAGTIMEDVPQIQAYLEQAEDLVEAMETLSQNPPYIGTNGNWYVWSTAEQEYVDSGIDASITVQIADVTMLAEGASPYITNTGTNTDPIFHLFIPIGATGADGFSPAVTVTAITGGHRVNITDASHPSGQNFDVMDGQDGASDWSEITNKPNFATVATSGSYSDLSNKPTIPAAQVNSDWNASSGVAQILNKPTIPDVSGKADKVSGATNGNFAGLDANGNLVDSGHKHSDYLTQHQSLTGYYKYSDTAETTLDDTDRFPFYDASASATRRSTWSNIKAKLKSYFDDLYHPKMVTRCKKYYKQSGDQAYSYVYSVGEIVVFCLFDFTGNKFPVDFMGRGCYGQILWDKIGSRWVKINIRNEGTLIAVSTVTDSQIYSWQMFGTFCARGKVRDEADGWGAKGTGTGWYAADTWESSDFV